MDYQILERDNEQLAQRIRNNEIQPHFLEYAIDGGFIRVRENYQFRTEMEQNIMHHFTFMMRVSFYEGLFEEITNFIQTYDSQYQQSKEIYQVWQQIGQIIINTNDKMIIAQKQLDAIHEYNTSGVTNEEFLQIKKDDTKKFLDKQFMIEQALKQRETAQNYARIEAEALTIISEGRIQLDWLQKQQENQTQFQQDLSIIQKQWDYDYKTFLDGSGFIDSINLNQIQIFQNKEWFMSIWAQQLNQQIQSANPYFTQLYGKYMGCYRFYLDNYELDQLTQNRQQIQQIKIEIAGRKAEKRYNKAFIQYWNDELIKTRRTLKVFQTNDQVKRLQECHTLLTQQLMNVQKAYENLELDVTRGGGVVLTVDLKHNNLQLQIEDPFKVIYSEETYNLQDKIKYIQQQIIYYEEELNKLKYAEQKLQELQKYPDILRKEIDQKHGQKISQADIFKAQFDNLLSQTELDNYNDLCFGRQGMTHLLGALSRYLVIKRDPCCLCLFSKKKLHQLDDIYYKEYEEQAAYVIRQLQNESNSLFTSAKERIETASQLRVIQIGTRLIIDSNILAAFRNEDGLRQINNGQRVFNAYGSIAYTINELCKLAVADYKSLIGLNSFTEIRFQAWGQYLNDAKNGKLAQNENIPE